MPRFASYTIIIVPLITTACSLGPIYAPQSAPNVRLYTEPEPALVQEGSTSSQIIRQHFEYASGPEQKWWLSFDNKTLTTLIESAFRESPTLEKAFATLNVANEDLAAIRGNLLFPAVDANPNATRQKIPGASSGSSSQASSVYSLYNASVNVTYQLDLFGASRSSVEAADAAVSYAKFRWQGVKAALAANVATATILEGGLRAKIAATQGIIALENEQLIIIQQQMSLGGASYTDLLQQRTRVAETESTLPTLSADLASTRHKLYAYVGRTPGEGGIPQVELTTIRLPTQLPLTLPSELVRQRPDMQAAEAQLGIANANLGIATANRFPQISLTADFFDAALSPSGMLNLLARGFDFAASATQPIFHGGELKARQLGALAAYDLAKAQYREVLIAAFRNVADVLKALQYDEQAVRIDTDLNHVASEALQMAESQYRLGGGSFLSLLVAQQSYERAKLALIDAKVARLNDTVALYLALGGGWDDHPSDPMSTLIISE